MSHLLREVHLPAELCEAAERRFSDRFGTLDNFLTYVLEQLVRDEAAQMDREDQRIIEERLKDLGYI
jgi:hypothetical protein